jgi:ribose 1,5-bisphosphokinase PhnN
MSYIAAVDQAVADGVDVNANPSRQAQILVKPGDYRQAGLSIFLEARKAQLEENIKKRGRFEPVAKAEQPD